MHTNTIGEIGELKFIEYCLKNDIPIYRPITDLNQVDFIVEYDNKFLKMQVKTTERIRKDGTMRFMTSRSITNQRDIKVYKYSQPDYFVFCCLENNFLGIYEVEKVSGTDFYLRCLPTKNKQSVNVRWFEDYKIEKILTRSQTG